MVMDIDQDLLRADTVKDAEVVFLDKDLGMVVAAAIIIQRCSAATGGDIMDAFE